MYLFEILGQLDEGLLSARGLKGSFRVGDFFPEFSVILSDSEVPTESKGWVRLLDSATSGYVKLGIENSDAMSSFTLGEWFDVESSYALSGSDHGLRFKVRVTELSKVQPVFVFSMSLGDFMSFDKNLHQVSSYLPIEGMPEVTLFSPDVADSLCKTSKLWWSVPARLTDSGFEFPLECLGSRPAQGYRARYIIGSELIEKEVFNLSDAFDLGDKHALVSSQVENELRESYGRVHFEGYRIKTVVNGINVLATFETIPLKDMVGSPA